VKHSEPSAGFRAGLLLLALAAGSSGSAWAQAAKGGSSALDSVAFVSEKLRAPQALEPLEDVQAVVSGEVGNAWQSFQVDNGGVWKGYVDARNGRVVSLEGSGIPWVPGRGNGLTKADLGARLQGKKDVDLATLDGIARAFLPRVASLLGVEPAALALNRGRSGQPADHVWNVDYDVVSDGLVVDGARVVFRVNHGNLVQMGSENLPPRGAKAPRAQVSREQALAAVASYLGGFSSADTFVDGGSLHLLTVAATDARFAEGFAFGQGRGLAQAWQLVFRRDGVQGTWRARVDAATGEILELVDVNDYAQATGGARVLGTSTNLPMPFTNVSSGGFTNSAGVYSFGGGTVTSSLAGQYARIADSCGAISLTADASGNLSFGTSAGTDCTTPGTGGAGNTHSARTQFYHLNRAKEIARGWLPGNSWLNAQLTANVNLNQTCNAYWNGATVNFFRSGGGCGNTGEIEAVSLHEYGHGLDNNDGNGSAPDKGTGETYGDFTAALATHSSCIGPGFRTTNCGGYGDACTGCTGVRDIDWAKRTSGVPHTVGNFTQARCPTSFSYLGPCGREGHCESYVSSEALWDLANRDLPSAGTGAAWSIVDRLWYLSRSTATGAFTCVTSTSPWSSNGCGAGSYWKTMRAVDDDDGNLANGTPHGGALFAAFNRHGIACATDPGASVTFAGCAAPAVPALSLTPGDNLVSVGWSGSSGVYDIYRNESGCNAGFIKIANDAAGASLNDGAVANGFTYYYQIVAHPSGSEACASAPSACVSAIPAGAPCTPPAAPAGLAAAASGSAVNLSWSAVAGALEYHVYRAATSGGPYSQVGTAAGTTFVNTGLAAGTYFYVVRAFAGCESASSNEASATVTAPADFALSISPASITVDRGGSTAVYTVTVTRLNGFSDPVSLSVSGLPSGTTGSFSPNPATGASAALTLSVSTATAKGTFTFTVSGTGGAPALTRTATARLVKSKPH
jgi:hypothetical protein